MKLYTINCPRCIVLEKKLDNKGINYEKVTDENIIKNMGITILPVLEVDGELLGFSEAVTWVNSQ